MRISLIMSLIGIIGGIALAKSLQPANACSCQAFDSERRTLSLISVEQTSGEEDATLLDAQFSRWDGEISTTMQGLDSVFFQIITTESDVHLLATLDIGEE